MIVMRKSRLKTHHQPCGLETQERSSYHYKQNQSAKSPLSSFVLCQKNGSVQPHYMPLLSLRRKISSFTAEFTADSKRRKLCVVAERPGPSGKNSSTWRRAQWSLCRDVRDSRSDEYKLYIYTYMFVCVCMCVCIILYIWYMYMYYISYYIHIYIYT